MTWLLAGRPQHSILVTRLRYLGDVVMSTILLEALRAGDPQVRLGYLCEEAHGGALSGLAHLDRVHLLTAPGKSADARTRKGTRANDPGVVHGVWAMSRELRQAKYDLAVDLFFNPRSALLLWLSGIKSRIGGTPKLRRHLYTETVLADAVRGSWPRLSTVAPGGLGDHLSLLAPLVHAESGLGFLEWVAGHFAPGTLRPFLTARTDTSAVDYLILAPGATWRSKEWPLANWRELVARLSGESGLCLRILVPPGRETAWEELAAGYTPDQVQVLPPLGLTAVKDQLAAARAVISVDGGVMHMSVALGTPTVALFGPTDPAIWFPYEEMGPYRVLTTVPDCHPCDLHDCGQFICLPELTVDQVAASLADLVQGSRQRTDRGYL